MFEFVGEEALWGGKGEATPRRPLDIQERPGVSSGRLALEERN